jgi:hypothetical protein
MPSSPSETTRIWSQGLVPFAVTAPERAIWHGHPGQDDREHFVRLSVETGKNLVAWWPVFPESKFQSKIAIVPRNFALE